MKRILIVICLAVGLLFTGSGVASAWDVETLPSWTWECRKVFHGYIDGRAVWYLECPNP